MEYWQSFSLNSRCRPIQENIGPSLLFLHLLHVSAIWRTNFSRFSFFLVFFFFLDIYSILLYIPPNSQTCLQAHSLTEDNFLQFLVPISKTFSAPLLPSPFTVQIESLYINYVCFLLYTDFLLFVTSNCGNISFSCITTDQKIFSISLPIFQA